MSQGIVGYQARLLRGDGLAPEGFEAFPETKVITPADPSSDEAEFTHLESPGFRKEFKKTFADGGEVAFEMNYIPNNAFQQSLRDDRDSGQIKNFKIQWRTNDPTNPVVLSSVVFAGWVKNLHPGDTNPSDPVMFSGSIRVTGVETWS